ncbi:MAG: class I SAM-dependent methyltransferase [Candidatus Sulfotelmatobacter sp.]|jgi:SAM-dependent methyltransferase
MNSNGKVRPFFGSTGGSHPLAKFTDQRETYGPHVVEQLVRNLTDLRVVVDLGAGSGRDLEIVRRLHPHAKLIAVEGGTEYAQTLAGKADVIHVANIERDDLPLADGEADLIIANQVLEHTKEIFWIFHEVSRSLKLGGHFLFGVPNICSLHNRFLLLVGRQPTQHKVCSAHVRPFSKGDTLAFLNACFPGGYELASFRGAQFYPFPTRLSRLLANAFPTFAFTIFFMIRKIAEYHGEFAAYPARAQLETNFWTGHVPTGSQYWPSAQQKGAFENAENGGRV